MSARAPAVVAALAFALLVPLLAVAAHSGDGTELVVTARSGGVLHPPGFPVQMWLDRAVVRVPFGPSDAWRVALLSALGHALATAFLVDALRRCGARGAAMLVGAAAFALFPACVTLAVQPEAFALAFAGCAASLDACIAAVKRAHSSLLDAALLGALAALCLAQHTITVVCAPAWVVAAFFIVARGPRVPAAIVGVGTFALVVLGLYLSLLLAARGSVWPDWGKLSSLADVVRHASRAEYGLLDLMGNPGDVERRGIVVLAEQVWRAWALLVLVAIAGAWRLRREHAVVVAVVGTLIAGLALLAIAIARAPTSDDADPTLERFLGIAIVPLSVLLGLGAEQLFAHMPARLAGASTAIAGAVALALALVAVPAVSARADRTLELYLEAVALSLPPDAIYLGSTDLETFGGARGRFPVKASGSMPVWYAREVLPVVEPRLAGAGGYPDERSLVASALATGAVVVASDDEPFPDDVPRELRGVLFAAGPGVTGSLSQRTIDGALALCPLVAQLDALPVGHGRLRAFRRAFARAFEGAGYAYAEAGRVQDAVRARAIAVGLAEASDPTTWRCAF